MFSIALYALRVSNKSDDLCKLFAGWDAKLYLHFHVHPLLRREAPRVQEVRAVGESEDSSWTLYHCALIVSLTTLSGGGAGVEKGASKLMVFQQVHI